MSADNKKDKESWIKLLVKYKGKCIICSKDIPQGEYALWSKASKAIKHLSCASTAEERPANQRVEEATTGERKKETIEGDQKEITLECFICGKTAGCSTCVLEMNCNRAAVSQACICEQCLSEKEPYDTYQRAFLSKIAKLKM